MSPGDRRLAGYNVLVVEDEYYLADDIARALSALGATVLGPVSSAADALEVLAGPEPVHLAVLDINLRDGKVFPLADTLAGKGMPFIFATGYDTGYLPSRHARVMHWEKPFDSAQLAAALPDILEPGDEEP